MQSPKEKGCEELARMLAHELTHLGWENHGKKREGGTKDMSMCLDLGLPFPNEKKEPKKDWFNFQGDFFHILVTG